MLADSDPRAQIAALTSLARLLLQLDRNQISRERLQIERTRLRLLARKLETEKARSAQKSQGRKKAATGNSLTPEDIDRIRSRVFGLPPVTIPELSHPGQSTAGLPGEPPPPSDDGGVAAEPGLPSPHLPSRDIPPMAKQICIFSPAGHRFPQRVIRKASRFRGAQPGTGNRGPGTENYLSRQSLVAGQNGKCCRPARCRRFGSFPENFSFHRHKIAWAPVRIWFLNCTWEGVPIVAMQLDPASAPVIPTTGATAGEAAGSPFRTALNSALNSGANEGPQSSAGTASAPSTSASPSASNTPAANNSPQPVANGAAAGQATAATGSTSATSPATATTAASVPGQLATGGNVPGSTTQGLPQAGWIAKATGKRLFSAAKATALSSSKTAGAQTNDQTGAANAQLPSTLSQVTNYQAVPVPVPTTSWGLDTTNGGGAKDTESQPSASNGQTPQVQAGSWKFVAAKGPSSKDPEGDLPSSSDETGTPAQNSVANTVGTDSADASTSADFVPTASSPQLDTGADLATSPQADSESVPVTPQAPSGAPAAITNSTQIPVDPGQTDAAQTAASLPQTPADSLPAATLGSQVTVGTAVLPGNSPAQAFGNHPQAQTAAANSSSPGAYMADVPATSAPVRPVAGANSSANTSHPAATSLGTAAVSQVSVAVSSTAGSANQGTGDGSGSSSRQGAAPAPSAFGAAATVSAPTAAGDPTNTTSAQGNGPQVTANDQTVPSPLPKPPQPASTSSHTVSSSQPDPEAMAKVQAGSGETGVSNTLGQGDVLASAQAATSITSAEQAQQNQASPSQVPTSSASPPPSTQDSQAANAQPAITPHLVQSAQQAEMRVGIQPEDLGPIEIRATMRGEELGAAISAQQPETRQWLVNHLGELAYNLDSQNVRVSQLSVSAPSAGGSLSPDLSQSGSGNQAGQQQQQTVSQFGYDEPASGTSGETDLISESYNQIDTRSGVDLRA